MSSARRGAAGIEAVAMDRRAGVPAAGAAGQVGHTLLTLAPR